MRIFVIAYSFIITCALPLNAQVIDYEIDPSFNSELLFTRGSVSDILLTETNQLLIMGSFNSVQSPVSSSALLNNNGALLHAANFAGAKVENYKGDYLQHGSDLNRFSIPGGGLYDLFKFEFKKQAYTGPLSNVALDAIVMPDDNILVAGRFFTDSTLMGTDQSHLGLRQLCMIDSTGAPVEGFPMLRCEWPTDAYISTILKLNTGEYIIAGTFDEVDGYYCPKLAKLNADFSVNTDFTSPFSAQGGSVGIRIIDSQDRIWLSYDSGVIFTDFPAYPSKLARILSNGQLDTSYVAPVFLTYGGLDPDNPTNPFSEGPVILEDTDGTFVLGGSFIEVNGQSYNRLIKINDAGEIIEGAFGGIGPDEAIWGTWTPNIGPIAGTFIRVLRKLPDGKILIGGQFSSFGGEPYSCLVRLQPSGYVGTENREGRSKLKIWPNPVGLSQPFVSLALPGVSERLELVEIYDLQGRVVLKPNVHDQSDHKIDIQNLPPGIYIVKAASTKGVYSQKLVVQ